ncbi:hypothetical protein CHUAL_004459 [Chamberlinius hualienensis]
MDFIGNPLKIIADELLMRLVTGNKEGEKVLAKNMLTSDHGREKVLGLYFASPGCPECSSFTELLKSSFDKIKRTHAFEIIYVCVDDDEVKDETCVQSEMPPWLVLSSPSEKIRAQLCKWLCVRTIPYFILIDGETGRIVTRNARQRLVDDPDGVNFPWSNKSLTSVLNETGLIDSNGASKSLDEIQGCIKGLYFSANWCPPCKAFTPQLVHTWTQLKNKKNGRFQVIFVSSDRSEDSFKQYFSTMPWLAVPYDQEIRRKELAEKFEVHGIPTLILLDEDDRIITRDGRHEVLEDIDGERFPWRSNLVEELTDRFSAQLNEAPLLVLFTDSAELEQSKEIVIPVAREIQEQLQADCNALLFFVGGESELCDSIRDLAHLEDEVPLLCIIDMERKEKYVFQEDVEMSINVVRQFVKQFFNGELIAESFCK